MTCAWPRRSGPIASSGGDVASLARGAGEPFRVVPDWVCEVLSPSDRLYGVRVKRRFYVEIGVSFVWYVDPLARTLTVSRLHAGRWLELGVHAEDERVRAEPFAELELDLGEWWS